MRHLLFLLQSLINYPLLLLNGLSFATFKCRGIPVIFNKGTITAKGKVYINSSKYKNVIGGDTRSSIVVKKGALLSMGDNVKISNSAIYCANQISIGNNVMIGGSTKIWDTDFHPLDAQQRLATPNENYKTAPIVIHNNVFIGGFSIILKGTEIGENSVISAGSVVRGKIPANEVWAGNPCVKIKNL
jgi:acetyltransferase-like isoleucine patch superfamily enzyme